MPVTARLLSGFDDPALDRAGWDALLDRSETNVAYLTHQWQSTWWEIVGRGTLLLVAAEDDGRVVALAPMYAEEGMVFFIGSGDADYLDMIGDVATPGVVDAIIDVAAANAPEFCGIRLYGLRQSSSCGPQLQKAAEKRGWLCYARSGSAAPKLDLVTGRDRAIAAANGPKVSKRDRYFSRLGSLELREATTPSEISLHLDTFLDQHIERWALAGVTSRFASEEPRRFLHTAVMRATPPLQPRLSWLDWQGRAIACEFAWVYRNTYFAVASSFAPDLASRSPGQVLQRRIVLAALRDGLSAYDFGHGDYPYKLHYATELHDLETWEAFPQRATDVEDPQ